MNANRIGRAVIVMIAIIAFGTAWSFRQQAALERSAAASLASRIQKLRDESKRWHARLEVAEDARAKTAAAAAANARKAAASGTEKKSKPGWLELMRTDPKVQALMDEYDRSGVLIEYGPLLHELHLDPGRAEAFAEAVARRREAQHDLGAALLAQGLTMSDPAAQAIMRKQQEEYDAQQRALLGDEGFARLRAYQARQPARMMVDSIAGAAVVARVPLEPAQLDRLTSAVVAASEGHWDATDWDKVDVLAKEFLTPQQFEFIRTNEAIGPLGSGWRFQEHLNSLITRGDKEDLGIAK
jgi:hypothetical protein